MSVLCNKEHQEAYRNNFVINSKSKELYRQKLYQKRKIFERNGLEYYILLSDEMNENAYQNILNKHLKEVALVYYYPTSFYIGRKWDYGW